MVSGVLQSHGWRVIQLGTNVPVPDVVRAVEDYRINSLLLSAALPIQIRTVRDTIDAVRRSERGATANIVVGGQAFSGLEELAEQIGADRYAASIKDIENLSADC